ncbi:AEC family transporter [Halogeometricum sp. S1BR25-6]|uniref:AEC family transporter n=1 Tax=Halogeometricum salsisoli TaxID=2950536 RepID=A0ABU2GIL5_9EURY|nr:AEC family transporter [Halogeometricum sp. S1BR25-6]MDS0300678.1 AEC family transporter [Halogeometricum sp. S1BR25-6]
MDVVSNLLYLLVLLFAGISGRRLGLLTESRADLLTQFAFYLALPALVFTSTSSQSLGDVLDPRLIAGFWLSLLVVGAFGWVVHRRTSSPATRSVAVVQSYHCNFGFLGLPITAAAFGDVATAKASVILGVGGLTQIPATVAVLAFVNEAEADLVEELRGFLANPVIGALVLGFLCSAVGVSIPGVVSNGLGAVAQLALPAALLAVGASLSFDAGAVDVPTVGSVVALKMLLMPVTALVAFSLLSADVSTTRAGVLMLAMPTAISTFIYATELGGDADLASANVFATTVASVGTILLVLQFVG